MNQVLNYKGININCIFLTAHRQLENEHENLEESKKL